MLNETAGGTGGDLLSATLRRVAELERQADHDARNIDSLQRALTSSRRIGAAIGIVMVTLKITETAAFEMLKDASQNSNRKLRDIADDVVTTGVVPAQDRPEAC